MKGKDPDRSKLGPGSKFGQVLESLVNTTGNRKFIIKLYMTLDPVLPQCKEALRFHLKLRSGMS